MSAGLLSLIAVFVSGFLVGYTGFGFNLLTVPVLALVIPAKDAVVVTLFLGVMINAIMAAMYRSQVQVRMVAALVAASIPGLLAGTAVFNIISPDTLRVVIGVLTLMFAVFMMRRKIAVPVPPGGLVTVGTGLLSGMLTSTTGMGGPPIVAYLMTGVGAADRVRATLVLYTALVSVVALVLLGLSHEVSSGQLGRAGLLVPCGLVGLSVGTYAFRKLPQLYVKAVASTLALVAVSGILLTVL